MSANSTMESRKTLQASSTLESTRQLSHAAPPGPLPSLPVKKLTYAQAASKTPSPLKTPLKPSVKTPEKYEDAFPLATNTPIRKSTNKRPHPYSRSSIIFNSGEEGVRLAPSVPRRRYKKVKKTREDVEEPLKRVDGPLEEENKEKPAKSVGPLEENMESEEGELFDASEEEKKKKKKRVKKIKAVKKEKTTKKKSRYLKSNPFVLKDSKKAKKHMEKKRRAAKRLTDDSNEGTPAPKKVCVEKETTQKDEQKMPEGFKKIVEEKNILPARFIGNQRRQYGGSRRAPKTIPEFKKSDAFPTEKEEKYLEKYAKFSKNLELTRQSSAHLVLETTKMEFTNLDQLEKGQVLHVHTANLIDIFIRTMIQKAGGNLKDTQFWMNLAHAGYREAKGLFIMHKTYKVVDGGVIINQIAAHMQSNKNITLDEGFSVSMNVFKSQEKKTYSKGGFRGSYRRRLRGKGSGKRVKIRNTVLEAFFGVKNNRVIGNSHCLAKAVVLGKLDTDRKSAANDEEEKVLAKQWRQMTDHSISILHREKAQLALAKKLLEDADLDPEEEDHDLDDIEQIADYMPEYQFIVWGIEGHQIAPSEIVRFNPDGTRFIGLFYHRHHYEFVNHTVKNSPSRFCYKCFKFSPDGHTKSCKARCRRCGRMDCGPGHAKIHCDKCNIDFRSQKCFDLHLTPTTGHALPFCSKYFYCKKCLTIDRTEAFRKVPHECGTKAFCYTCRKKVRTDHKCSYHLPTKEEKAKKKEEQKKWKIIVYDLECINTNSGEYKGNCTREAKHEPNFIGVQMFCDVCFGEKDCDTCLKPWSYSYKDAPEDERSTSTLIHTSDEDSDEDSYDMSGLFHVEERHTPLARFAKFLRTDPKANNAYVIAHNGGGYDHPQVLAELDRQGGVNSEEPKIILNGMTIISADFRYKKQRLHFRDSLQYLPMALAKMPEAFGLDGEAKGYFPHLWNHPDNYDKVLPTLPPKVYYDSKFMDSSKLKDFEEWYEEHYNDGFNLHDELEKYCMSDVRILTLTLIAFIKLCGKLFNGWNPIINGCTLASYAMFVMKNEYIQPGDIGYIPENGYNSDRNSAMALKYLQWLEKQDPSLHLQYMLRGGEHSITVNDHTYKVDGYNRSTNEVFEVHGCLWHGCPKCQPIRDKKNAMCDKTPQELFDRTKRREDDIKSAGYTLHTIWECEINEKLDSNPEMKRFFDLNQYTRRLDPRAGVFGGRAQAFRAIVEAIGDILIDYMDFISMYPYLNAGGTAYPRGNPIVLTDDFPNIKQPLTLRGIVFCDVLPSTNAKMGYLPARFCGKLMFTLCRTCAQDQNTWGQCTHHKFSERYLTGVWTTEELNKAISRGYKVLKYHEIWYWPEQDWVKGGFFASYIKPLLAVKYESSGWPRENMSDEEKKAYVDSIEKNDGVKLNASNIKKNKALRSLSKIFLNSAWGKFAQNPMKNETRLVSCHDGATIANFINDPLYEPTGWRPFGEHKLWISRKPKKGAAHGAPHTNLPIGIITTSAGRLRLIEGMERVGVENMIYCDTDSLIFTRKRGEDPLGDLRGEHLGYLISEIPEGKAITKTVIMAPKAYGLQIKDEATGEFDYNLKSKGITMHCENTKRITFDGMEKAMKEFIEDGVTAPLEGEMLTFKRGCNAFDGLWTCISTKQLNPRMDKGHFVEGVAVPFGQLPSHTALIDDYPFY